MARRPSATTRYTPWIGLVRLLLIGVGLAITFSLMPLRGRGWISVLIGVVAIGAITPLTIRRVHRIRTSDHPMLDAGEALLSVLALLVLGFSAVYLAINRHAGQFAGLHTRIDAVYFTLTTLSTVGFGDITATGQAARIAVTAQILLDFVFVGVTVRVLLDAAHQRRSERA
ncbi:MAG: potassium channel family protein [Ilumatobacteraceae bacterium]|nr:two pore domain potassium channel family protein [Ilumatobacter sp.]MCB0983084.1 two pore domain potassium channel family protein [Ilumatobacter sp.]